ncbi:hypothetical protein PHIM7_55 [Sinorhizobium phage phiM7]|uniref:Transmembrane protein n=3 Tax=Emdodecavirus TaxID=1980937 RepID=S5MV20_9CAUD|nr:hypothetical protein AB690_gp062 [Sinorhizobium phage phiM12]YP_009212311.1 hypothetical protein AVT40_gp071 [Sinorhizobium phage phiN3]YP_009601180.1 hypothetical protein FDH46_gp055 [Sinorhizobium phage phiM7]AKF12963.1 hypothetical protein PHIM19_56 [Sinorhizobium phage phiM19]AGR47707.1 hypothetical protein SmphiM12_075 [Sinorhizobium phage phiM12]AKF12603.1 hypothetical protein PHIM7_55 [Sinorhizobium phage phiM7]AKF13336.1 hypothetical protein PHIN3_71 [Sinorhizobium phage phiN3]
MNLKERVVGAAKWVGCVALGSYVLIAMACFPIVVYANSQLRKDRDYFVERTFDYKKKFDYLFDGASERDLLDICEEKQEVLFKEDCAKPLLK